MSKITVIGSSNMDLTVRTPHIPVKGETIFGGDVMMSFGGKGANQAVAVSRLGGDVNFITKLGADANGKLMADHFAEEGLGADGIIVDSSVQSGSAWICVDDNGDNMIIVMPGANGALTSLLPSFTNSEFSAIVSYTVFSGSMLLCCWSTYAIFTVSPIVISPVSGVSRPMIRRKRVVLPAPLGPITPTIPAGGSTKLRFSYRSLSIQ